MRHFSHELITCRQLQSKRNKLLEWRAIKNAKKCFMAISNAAANKARGTWWQKLGDCVNLWQLLHQQRNEAANQNWASGSKVVSLLCLRHASVLVYGSYAVLKTKTALEFSTHLTKQKKSFPVANMQIHSLTTTVSPLLYFAFKSLHDLQLFEGMTCSKQFFKGILKVI